MMPIEGAISLISVFFGAGWSVILDFDVIEISESLGKKVMGILIVASILSCLSLLLMPLTGGL